MLKRTLLDFRGRMGRLSYLLCTAGLLGVTAAWAGGTALLLDRLTNNVPALVAVGLATALVAAAWLWAVFAITAKRLRDAGLPPAVCLVGYVVLVVFDSAILTHAMPQRFYWPWNEMTPYGGALAAITVIVLCLAPGRGARPAARTNETAPFENEEGAIVAVPV